MKYEVGLVLSGGGARGIAHLGVIKALEEIDIKPDVISGTSAGAIIGILYAYGYSTNDILKLLLDLNTFKLLQPALSTTGLLKMEVIYKFLKKYLPENSFDSLKIPTTIAATNIRTGTTEYFNDGDLLMVTCASSCIPVLFNPVEYNGEKYIDGGILNNLPVEAIRKDTKFIIGSHSNPIDEDFEYSNVSAVMQRALMLAITRNVTISAKECDFLIEPRGLEPFKVMDIGKAKDIFRIGYQEAKSKIESFDLKSTLSK